MKSNSELRTIARNSLKGNWVKAVLVCLILFSIIGGFTIIMNILIMPIYTQQIYISANGGINPSFIITFSLMSFLSLILGLFFAAPLIYGFSSFFINLVRSENPAVENIFDGFKKFWQCTSTCFLTALIVFLWSLLLIMPMITVSILITFSLLVTLSEGASIVLSILLFLVNISIGILFATICTRYALVYYLIKDSEKTTALNYIKQSKIMMKGKAFKLIFLNLSFIGWSLLAALTCGIGMLFLIPYMSTTFAAFYEDVLEESKMKNIITYVTLKNNDINQFYTI